MNNHLTVKELPESEKPYEKCLRYGAQHLSDAELLAVIIRTGTCGRQSVDLAKDILNCKEKSLINLHYLSIKELTAISGIGAVKAVQLKCVAEITKRMAKAVRRQGVSLRDASSVAAYYMEELRHEDRESFCFACLIPNVYCWGRKSSLSGRSTPPSSLQERFFKRHFPIRPSILSLCTTIPAGCQSPAYRINL